MNRSLALLPLLLVLPSIGCPHNDSQNTRHETRTLALKPGGELRVRTFNGAIRVTTWDRAEVEVDAEIREQEGSSVQFIAEAKDGQVLLRAEKKEAESRSWNFFGFGGGGVTFTLKIPKEALATLETSNGAISIRGLKGALDARTSNGKVEVQELNGNAVLRTSNGQIRAETVQGSLEATTSNGSITATDIQGKAALRTSNGAVKMARIQGPVNADTSNGSIKAEALADDLIAESSNGKVELDDVLGKVDVSTNNGSITARNLDGKGRGIRLRTSNARITVTLGKAEGELTARTSNRSQVSVAQKGELQEDRDGTTRAKIGKGTQRIELTTTHGRIAVD